MCVTAILAGATAIGGLAQASAARSAARSQTRAARNQIQLQERIYNENVGRFAPYEETGRNALAAYNYEMGLGDQPEGYQGYQITPDYQFRMSEGLRGVEAGAAARGGLYSGAAMQALQERADGIASQGHGNYLNRLAGLAASGQNAAGQGAAAGQNFANGASNAYANIGNAQAAGAVGQANAFSGMLNNAVGIYQYQNMLNSLR